MKRFLPIPGIAFIVANVVLFVLCLITAGSALGDMPGFDGLSERYEVEVLPLLHTHCGNCHSAEKREGELDLARFTSLTLVRGDAKIWQTVLEMLENGEMPPEEAVPLKSEDRERFVRWVRDYLDAESRARVGDPGPVVLRRLNNAQYTYTLRDLTGLKSIDPARDFPVDGAAGEGFTNTGQSLVMSPSLVTKYLDASKAIVRHAVLLPDGIRFFESTTRTDQTNEILTRIREFYRQFADTGGGATVNLQGVIFDTNQGGRLPIERYLAATLEERESLFSGAKTTAEVASERGLNARYLGSLWKLLSVPADAAKVSGSSTLVVELRQRWREAKVEDAVALAEWIGEWQSDLWQFSSVGHIGKAGGPKSWMEAVDPVATQQEIRVELPKLGTAREVVLYLTAGDAGDGNEYDVALWERPRLVSAGRPDLLLRDVRQSVRSLTRRRERIHATVVECLAAAAEAQLSPEEMEVERLAAKHKVDVDALASWLEYLGIQSGNPTSIGPLIDGKATSLSGYDFVRGWVGDEALSVIANASDTEVRVPGRLRPKSIAVHPTPTRAVVVGWRCPEAASVRVEGTVQHAHPECGNGIGWLVELRRGSVRQKLASGHSQGDGRITFGTSEALTVRPGDFLTLSVEPRDGNHSCDLTAIDLTIQSDSRQWNLSHDVAVSILAGNPHPDPHGNADVWHFFSEPAEDVADSPIPTDSMLAKWLASSDIDAKRALASKLQEMIRANGDALEEGSPDARLVRQLVSLGGPLVAGKDWGVDEFESLKTDAVEPRDAHAFGLDERKFGRIPAGKIDGNGEEEIDPASLCSSAPSTIEIRLPADLVEGMTFVATGRLHPSAGKEGSIQLWASTTAPADISGVRRAVGTEANLPGPWTSNNRVLSFSTPVLVTEGSSASSRTRRAFGDFRQWFPPALCYTKIVPVDEVVTLTLYHREDSHLQRLMLDESQTADLNRMWDELHYVSQDALKLVDAFAQLLEYASQDADPSAFEPLREPIDRRAADFRKRLVDNEPVHLDAIIAFAQRAYRRPLRDTEGEQLRQFYSDLRQKEIPHDEAVRLTLVRILTSPTFLYRIETPATDAQQGPVTDDELASRLSYFLWSSCPDRELFDCAASGRLRERSEFMQQVHRMLRDENTRRMSVEFACQWLHIHDFVSRDEKSERHFPTFAGLREAMFEESVRFFQDMIQTNGSVLSVLDADHTFLNESLAGHYGIPGVQGSEWRRVEGVRRHGRGGVLGLSTILATQSGASRTSPILRGNWLSEVMLGERLPRPPKDVPPLADEAPQGLTERQLTERHSSDPACAKCHVRIDPFGFALEHYDAIGRYRSSDVNGLPIDAKTTLPDGTRIDGVAGLRAYLLAERRESFLRQFNRKLLGYALGRSVQLSDEPLLAEMRDALESNDYRFWSAVGVIVESRPFREIRGREGWMEN